MPYVFMGDCSMENLSWRCFGNPSLVTPNILLNAIAETVLLSTQLLFLYLELHYTPGTKYIGGL